MLVFGKSILIKHESCGFVCLSVHVFLNHQKSQLHEILAQGVIDVVQNEGMRTILGDASSGRFSSPKLKSTNKNAEANTIWTIIDRILCGNL